MSLLPEPDQQALLEPIQRMTERRAEEAQRRADEALRNDDGNDNVESQQ